MRVGQQEVRNHAIPPSLVRPDGVARNRARSVRVEAVRELREFDMAQSLVDRRYAGIGIKASRLSYESDNLQTLRLTDGDRLVGTLSVRADGPRGLAADRLFKEELDGLRSRFGQICEVTRLAVDAEQHDKTLLAKLFHVCWLHAHFGAGADLMVFEVHPRHGQIYQRILGAELVGSERMHEVGAPAVLVCISSEFIAQQIAQFAGKEEEAGRVRMLYPYFYGPEDEARIVQDLRSGQAGFGGLA